MTLLKIEELCKEFGNIPTGKSLIKRKIVISMYTLEFFIQKNFNISIWQDYFRLKGYPVKGDLLVNGKYITANKIILDDLNSLVANFKIEHGHMPNIIEFSNKNNLPCWETASKILKSNNINTKEFFEAPDKINRLRNPRPQVDYYNKYIEIFKNEFISKEYINAGDLSNNTVELPTASWLVKYCPDKNVKTYSQFLEWCGFKPYVNISKEVATEIIYNMQSKLDRPISGEDFNNPKVGELGIRTVRRIWGEAWKMQQELGLTITGKHADKYTIQELKESINNICNTIYNNENRKIITYNDIKNNCIPGEISTYDRYFKKELGLSFREYLQSIGFDMPQSGNGMNYTFNDGEKVKSQIEYNFSLYLRNILNLKYNVDFQREVKYKTFTNCKNNCNCDYIIKYKNRIIYVEIAGMLKPEKKLTFKNDTYNSKSKEKYRRSLTAKEYMFIEAGLDYYILFSDDISDDILNEIFNK